MSEFNVGFHEINHINDKGFFENNLIKKIPEVFSDKIGTFNKFKLKLHLNENESPKVL